MDGFDAALKHDAHREPQPQLPTTTAISSENTSSRRQAPSLTKEPREVILYGYPPDSSWAAISHYETVSKGMICEDYEREPPSERKRFQGATYVHARALTKAEKIMANEYKGGQCWIKVTFDSIEAAERATYYSPHIILGHCVYAEQYRGQGPKVDEPILEDRQKGLLKPPKSMPRQTRTLGPSFTISSLDRANYDSRAVRANATLPRSFQANSGAESGPPDNPEDPSFSPSTASSGTATAIEYPSLNQRGVTYADGAPSGLSKAAEGSPTSTTFRHFPDTPRTILRPAAEAFLPQISWKESMYRWLTIQGLVPGDLIGNTVPRLENGDFDSSAASFYWKFFYWIDTYFGTDWCGLKEN